MKLDQAMIPLAVCAYVLLTAVGCGDYKEFEDHGDGSVALLEQQLAVGSPVKWTQWPSTDIRVCYYRDPSLSIGGYINVLSDLAEALDGTWAKHSRLVFEHDLNCSAVEADGALKLSLNSSVAAGTCATGLGAVCNIGVGGSDVGVSQRVAVHEVGHALGLVHEHQRQDAPALCPSEALILQNAINSLVDPANGTSNQRQAWQNAVSDRTTLPTPVHLTDFDAASIMNYCSIDDGLRANDDWTLSSLSQLGIEIIYPSTYSSHPIRGAAGSSAVFRMAGGSSGADTILVARDNAVLTDDWTSRGADLDAYDFGPAFYHWGPDGAIGFQMGNGEIAVADFPSCAEAASLCIDAADTAAELAACTQEDALCDGLNSSNTASINVRAQFDDFFARQHLTETARVSVDHGLHAAMLSIL